MSQGIGSVVLYLKIYVLNSFFYSSRVPVVNYIISGIIVLEQNEKKSMC